MIYLNFRNSIFDRINYKLKVTWLFRKSGTKKEILSIFETKSWFRLILIIFELLSIQ